MPTITANGIELYYVSEGERQLREQAWLGARREAGEGAPEPARPPLQFMSTAPG